ncbi:MAG: aconitate hydratase [Tannerella sp.]|jgi:aconitate hydratase|nr:aconitate hydratase [Tannerella sp.]
MKYDHQKIAAYYRRFVQNSNRVKAVLNRPMTLAEKILYAHLYRQEEIHEFKRGIDYADFRPDRVAMQDATAQMALLQFMNAGQRETAIPSSVHCDHLIQAYQGAQLDMQSALHVNREVYAFLQSVSDQYGIDFWTPGAGIIHQVVLENYAFPGGMMVGTDSHTPNAGGLGMIAIGVGGADAADVMTNMPWELKMPRLTGVRLTGRLNGWTSAKDIILKLVGILTAKGATNAIIEYFGPGAETIPATGKATVCNMGAEVGATASVFPFDAEMVRYLRATSRDAAAKEAEKIASFLKADDEVVNQPEKYFDRIIEIDLSTLEPYINGPFTPDAATPVSAFAEKVRAGGYPEKVAVGLIGSCTNSSYQDLNRTASIARQVFEKEIPVDAQLIINPGSEQIRTTAERDGLLDAFEKTGGILMANACGPCIGQWHRITGDHERPNSIVTSFNRNFSKRADGNPNTHAFVASPEMVMALTIAGKLTFNPLKDSLLNRRGEWVTLDPPSGHDLPPDGFDLNHKGCLPPSGKEREVIIDPKSDRLQLLEPFAPWDGKDLTDMPLLIKVKGKCTTDHISMAGPWLRFRGHLENISGNLLMGAINAFNGQANSVKNQLNGEYGAVSAVAKAYKNQQISSVVVAEENYGEGSSREHAAMEPRFLQVRVILAKSFARIHETNLKKQGMLALTFADPDDYDSIREDDRISLTGLQTFTPGIPLRMTLKHADGSYDFLDVNHSYNAAQIAWFIAGSALNCNKGK